MNQIFNSYYYKSLDSVAQIDSNRTCRRQQEKWGSLPRRSKDLTRTPLCVATLPGLAESAVRLAGQVSDLR